MSIVAVKDYAELSRIAANEVIETVNAKPGALLVLPTGRTPVGMFARLVEASRDGRVDFSAVRFVTLDEYAGIPGDDRRRLLAWLGRELLDPLEIPPEHVVAFNPETEPSIECARIESAIGALGGIDLAVLGLGPNGHVGFNEPGSEPASRTREIVLTAESIASNAGYWGSEQDVPRTALTLGLATLFEAKSLVVIVSGQAKAEIVARTLSAPTGSDVPATALRAHPRITFMADAPALSSMDAESLNAD